MVLPAGLVLILIVLLFFADIGHASALMLLKSFTSSNFYDSSYKSALKDVSVGAISVDRLLIYRTL